MYVPSRAVAEEVVQETWLAVLIGLERFERRSSLQTWLFCILVNRARTRGRRERRTVPFATLDGRDADGDERPAGHSAALRERWEDSPERSLQSAETLQVIREAIERLSPMQRMVITLRDLEGWGSEDVRTALGLSQTNQRVLLHRARASVRTELETYFRVEPPDDVRAGATPASGR